MWLKFNIFLLLKYTCSWFLYWFRFILFEISLDTARRWTIRTEVAFNKWFTEQTERPSEQACEKDRNNMMFFHEPPPNPSTVSQKNFIRFLIWWGLSILYLLSMTILFVLFLLYDKFTTILSVHACARWIANKMKRRYGIAAVKI